jgi:hypothetical protein
MQDSDARTMLALAAADEPPCEHGSADVFTRARRIRTRQRLTMMAAGVATAAVVATVVAVVGPVGRSSPSHQGAAGTPTAVAPGGQPTANTARVPVTDPVEMLAVLKGLMPAGTTTSASEFDGQTGFASLVLHDADGQVLIEVNVTPGYGSATTLHRGDAGSFGCAARTFPTGTTCIDDQLPDGTLVVSASGPNDDPRSPEVTERMVSILTPDQVVITVGQWNDVHQKTGPKTRPTLTLSLAQMQAIALSPAWFH